MVYRLELFQGGMEGLTHNHNGRLHLEEDLSAVPEKFTKTLQKERSPLDPFILYKDVNVVGLGTPENLMCRSSASFKKLLSPSSFHWGELHENGENVSPG